MSREFLARFLCFGFICAAATIAGAQSFSADLFDLSGKQPASMGKVYTKGDKVRVERTDTGAEGARPIVIVDLAKHDATIMDGNSHTYMQTDLGPEAGISFFHLSDANNACAELDKMAKMQGSCKKTGNETVDGRNTVKYQGTSEDGKDIVVWADPELHYVIKWQGKDGDMGEMRNIKVGDQAASLFEVPSNYHKMGEAAPQK